MIVIRALFWTVVACVVMAQQPGAAPRAEADMFVAFGAAVIATLQDVRDDIRARRDPADDAV